jgi:hypothetical protein
MDGVGRLGQVSISGNYVALYCLWGEAKLLRLKTEKVKAFRVGIEISTLATNEYYKSNTFGLCHNIHASSYVS